MQSDKELQLWDVSTKQLLKSHILSPKDNISLLHFYTNDKVNFVTSKMENMQWKVDKTTKPSQFDDEESKKDEMGIKPYSLPHPHAMATCPHDQNNAEESNAENTLSEEITKAAYQNLRTVTKKRIPFFCPSPGPFFPPPFFFFSLALP